MTVGKRIIDRLGKFADALKKGEDMSPELFKKRLKESVQIKQSKSSRRKSR